MDIDESSDIGFVAGERDGQVASVGSSDGAGLVDGRAFDEDFERAADHRGVEFGCEFTLERFDSVNSFLTNLRRHLVGQFGGGSSLSGAEREDVDSGESDFTADRNSVFELRLGFAWKPDDHIGGEGGSIESISESLDGVEELAGVVASSHSAEYAVGPTLQGGVKLRAEVFAVGGGLDEFVVDLTSLDTRKSHSPLTGDPVEVLKEVMESKGGSSGASTGGVDAEVSDVDPGEHDFSESGVQQSSHLVLDVLRRPAGESGSDGWDDAVGAFQDAAVLDFDVGSLSAVEVSDTAW